MLNDRGAPAGVIRDYALVVSELVTNVIEHSASSVVEIAFEFRDDDWWEMEVVGGPPVAPKQMLAPEMWTVASAHEVAGRGLGIVRQLMDEVITNVTPDQVSVRCRRRRSAAS